MDAWVPFLTSLVWPAFIIVFLFIARRWVEDIIRVLRKRIESGAGVSMKMGAGEFTIKQAVEQMAEKQDKLEEQHHRIEDKANTTESTLNSLTSLVVAPPFESSYYGRFVDRRVDEERTLIIGCRKFTEQRVLCALLTVLLRRETEFEVVPKYDYGGAMESFVGLARGDIDLYPEYTWTGFELAFDTYLSGITPELARLEPGDSIAELNRIYGSSPYPISWVVNLGFQNNWEMVMLDETAARKGIEALSDLKKFPDEFVLGCETEFFKRTEAFGVLAKPAPDGYDIDFRDVRFFSRESIYHALNEGQIDVIDGYSTDPQLHAPEYRQLADDKHRFGTYSAAVVARTRLLENHPLLESVLQSIAEKISSEEIGRMVQEAEKIRPDDEMKHFAIEGIARRFLDRKAFLRSEPRT